MLNVDALDTHTHTHTHTHINTQYFLKGKGLFHVEWPKVASIYVTNLVPKINNLHACMHTKLHPAGTPGQLNLMLLM